MTMVEDKLNDQLLGYVFRDFKYYEKSVLILYFSETEELSHMQKRIWIDGVWRLSTKIVVHAGFLDEDEDILRELNRLIGQRVVSLSAAPPSGDLRLVFSQGEIFETFGCGTPYEQWELRNADGYRLGIGENF